MSDSLKLQSLVAANRTFMDLSREINAAQISTLLGVAIWGETDTGRPSLSLTELSRLLRLPASTISRHLRYLGKQQREGRPGLGLVELLEHPRDGRRKVVRLTERGERLVAKLNG